MKHLLLAVLGTLPVLLAQDYFPLQTGNQWLYRGSRFGQTLSVEVGESAKFDGIDYFAVSGFSPDRRWLRRDSDGAILEYDQNSNTVRPFLSLQFPEGQQFVTNINDCTKTGIVRSRAAKVTTPATGTVDKAIQINYIDSNCADAGIESDYFVENVGLVKRVETSFAGPVTYELIYATVDGNRTITQPEVSFSLSTPSPIFVDTTIVARLTIRNGDEVPLRLDFSSGQIYNFVLYNADGDVVYNWSANKLFPAVLQTILVNKEKNWLVTIDLPQNLNPGMYALEGYLTTSGTPDRPYRARVKVEVRAH